MLRKLRAVLGIALALAVPAGLAHGASIVSAQVLNTPPGGKFGLGELIEVQIGFDFQDSKTFGGGLELDFDSLLVAVESFELDPRWGFDPGDPTTSFSRPFGFFNDRPKALAVGDFTPFRGPGIVGRLVLRAIAMGDGSVVPGPNDRPAGPFIDEAGGTLGLTFQGAEFSIIPEPGTLLLVGAGLLGLAATRRPRE